LCSLLNAQDYYEEIEDKEGLMAIFNFQELSSFENGVAEYVSDGKHGLIDKQFVFITPREYDDIKRIENGTLEVLENGHWFTINGHGECIKNCPLGEENLELRDLDSFSRIEMPSFPPYLTNRVKHQLDLLAEIWKESPDDYYTLSGRSGGCFRQDHSWDHVFNCIQYLVDEHGVERENFIFQYGLGGEHNTVTIRKTEEWERGPICTPPPFPDFTR